VKTITVRTDEQVEEALRELTSDGFTRSEAVRRAILLAGQERRRKQLVAEARALAEDPDDLAEMRAIQADLEPLRAW